MSRQTFAATTPLSPVMTFTAMPRLGEPRERVAGVGLRPVDEGEEARRASGRARRPASGVASPRRRRGSRRPRRARRRRTGASRTARAARRTRRRSAPSTASGAPFVTSWSPSGASRDHDRGQLPVVVERKRRRSARRGRRRRSPAAARPPARPQSARSSAFPPTRSGVRHRGLVADEAEQRARLGRRAFGVERRVEA